MARGSSADRARRLLALLRHLTPGQSIPLARLAALIGASPDEIADDIEVLSLCGVAPYMPDDLIAVYVEDGEAHVWAPLPALDRAVRLSASEARALAAALQAAGFSPDDPLTSRLLAASSTGFDAEELAHLVRSAVSQGQGGVYSTLALAVERGDVVRITYRSTGSETETERDIEPLSMLNDRGAWYVSARCRRAGALRTFRLDRIHTASSTDEHFERPRDAKASSLAFVPDGLPVATLRFASAKEFSARDWPGARVIAADSDSATVEVPFGGTAWIARMVAARLGAVEVLGPPEIRAAVREVALHEADALALATKP
ncbi:MAG: WYL domain-containing protein [Actinomycetota bacterium]|nr:WYL domain-containing protein [Actinomycetota bacterium]